MVFSLPKKSKKEAVDAPVVAVQAIKKEKLTIAKFGMIEKSIYI